MNFHQTSRKKYVPAVHLQGVLKLNSLKLTPGPQTTLYATGTCQSLGGACEEGRAPDHVPGGLKPSAWRSKWTHPGGEKKHIQTWWTFPTPPQKKIQEIGGDPKNIMES